MIAWSSRNVLKSTLEQYLRPATRPKSYTTGRQWRVLLLSGRDRELFAQNVLKMELYLMVTVMDSEWKVNYVLLGGKGAKEGTVSVVRVQVKLFRRKEGNCYGFYHFPLSFLLLRQFKTHLLFEGDCEFIITGKPRNINEMS